MSNIYDENNQVIGQVQQIEKFTNIDLGDIRIASVGGNPYFCLSDTLKILDISVQYRTEIIDNMDHGSASLTNGYKEYYYIDIPVQTGIKADGTPAIRNTKVVFISEPVLYMIIFRSNKPKAKEFQDWIYYQLLPSARQLGRDETIETLQKRISELEEENKQIKADDKEHYNYAKLVDALLQSMNAVPDQVIISSRPSDIDDPNDPRSIFM